MSSLTISSLALLKARYDSTEKADYLSSFFPFIIYILKKKQIESFALRQLQEFLVEDFGLIVPLHTLTLLANRMSKKGYVTRKDKQYKVNEFNGDIDKFEADRAEAIRHQNATIAGLIEHARTKLNIPMTEDEALNALYTYIDQYCIEFVNAHSCGTILAVRGQAKKNWRFIVSSYVSEISKIDPARIDYFLTTIKGRMLANALLGTDLIEAGMKFKNTKVYLDSPIILQLLGIVDQDSEKLANEMLHLLLKANAFPAVFTHNLEEVKRILKNAEKDPDYQYTGYGNVVSSLTEIGKTQSDIALIRAGLEEKLESLKISIDDYPPYDEHLLQIDEEKLSEEMKVAKLFYRHSVAQKADINSVRSIFVLRKGSKPKRVEDCGHIMVTNNGAFARAAYNYGINHEEFKSMSPIITDVSITNILWLKSPMDFPELPKHLITANCYAALRPSPELWSNFLEEIKKLESSGKITTQQHTFLRYELRVRDELMNLTLGDETALSNHQIYKILDRYEQEIIRPFRDELEGLKKSHGIITGKAEKSERRLEHFDEATRRIGKLVEGCVNLILLIPCVLMVSYAHGLIGDSLWIESLSPIVKWASRAIFWLVTILTVINKFTGFKLWNPISHLSRKCNEFSVSVLTRYFIAAKNT